MNKTAFYIGFFLLLLPIMSLAELGAPGLVWAQTASPACSVKGYTVVYVNGIWGDETKVNEDLKQLKRYFSKNDIPFFNGERVDFKVGFNPSELGGTDDVLKTLQQLQAGQTLNFNEDHDVDQILAQLHGEIKTQKILLVGHSQGSFYTNEIYKYLIDNGIPPSAIAVYNIATPADYVAGRGVYLTSSNDSIINAVRKNVISTPMLYGTKEPLPTNITIDLQPNDDTGHLFVATYLNGVPERVVSDIQAGLSKLTASRIPRIDEGCFNPPDTSWAHNTAVALHDYGSSAGEVTYIAGVATAVGTVAAVQIGYAASVAFLNGAKFALIAIVQFGTDSISLTTHPPSEQKKVQTTEKIINKLYGSSVDSLSPQDKKELLGAAVILAKPNAPKTEAVSGIVLGTSTVAATSSLAQTDPALSALPTSTPQADALQVATSTATSTPQYPPVDPNFFNWLPGGGSGGLPAVTVADTEPATTTSDIADSTPTTSDVLPTDPVLMDITDLSNPPFIINEIEWAGDMFDSSREWVEFKNRTASDIDLSSYVLYAKDGGSQYIPLQGTLPANGFFVLQHNKDAPLSGGVAQVYPFDQLADSGEQLALARVDNTGTTTIDLTPALGACNGWCAGSGVSAHNQGETLSMERISADAAGADASNWASNDTYTVVPNMPTPAGQPWLANGLPLYATPLQKNSLHLPATGFYCSPDVYPLVPGANYHPQTGQCTVLDRDIGYPGPLSAGVFKGVVGSSTEVGFLSGAWRSGKIGSITVDFSNAEANDQYFAAIWKPNFDASLGGAGRCANPNDDVRMPSYFTTGHWLARDGWCGDFTVDMTDAPDLPYVFIPFIYQPN